MRKRTTIELDVDLVERAKRALGTPTTRETVERALQQVAGAAEDASAERALRQRRYLADLAEHVDVDVLAAEHMWR